MKPIAMFRDSKLTLHEGKNPNTPEAVLNGNQTKKNHQTDSRGNDVKHLYKVILAQWSHDQGYDPHK